MRDFNFGSILNNLNEPVEIAGRKIPKLAIVATGGLIVVGLVLLSRRGRSADSPTRSESRQGASAAFAGEEGLSPDVVAGNVEGAIADVRQQFEDSLTTQQQGLASQLEFDLAAQSAAFDQQLAQVQEHLTAQGSFQPLPDIPFSPAFDQFPTIAAPEPTYAPAYQESFAPAYQPAPAALEPTYAPLPEAPAPTRPRAPIQRLQEQASRIQENIRTLGRRQPSTPTPTRPPQRIQQQATQIEQNLRTLGRRQPPIEPPIRTRPPVINKPPLVRLNELRPTSVRTLPPPTPVRPPVVTPVRPPVPPLVRPPAITQLPFNLNTRPPVITQVRPPVRPPTFKPPAFRPPPRTTRNIAR